MNKIFGYEVSEWIFALLDVLDGNEAPHDIRSKTGLSAERSAEISKMFYAAAGLGVGFPTEKDIEKEITRSSRNKVG